MRTIGNFAPLWDDKFTSRPSLGSITRKRPHADDDSDDQDQEDRPTYPPPDPSRTTFTSSQQRLDPHHVAGHDPDALLPTPMYPHQPVSDSSPQTWTDIGQELASLNPPLFPSRRPDGETSSLQSQHAAVMSAIVHTCLLRADYDRAARAFGVLLRATSGSHALSLRNDGNWGIGAEILLQQGLSASRKAVPGDDSDTDSVRDPVTVPLDLSAARDYYEALILQYPYRKQTPNAVDARTFYPALFGIMIYEASALAAENSESTRRTRLRAACAIAARMDELLLSPPYDRFAPLLRLRGMVGLWTADLTTSAISGDFENDDDIDTDEHAARTAALDAAQDERGKARACFERCTRAGGTVPESALRHTRDHDR